MQLLLDKLSKAVEKVDVSVKLDLLISCATAIVSSPTISPVLCGSYEYMVGKVANINPSL